MQNLRLGHCIWLSMRSPHPLKAVTFFVSCHRDKFPYNYCTWQVMILILAWISRAVTCCAYRTGPERAADFLSGFDGGNKEPQNTHRVASRHSLAHLHSHLRSCQRCWLRQSLCVCCCVFVYACVKCVGTHRQPTPPRRGPPAPWCGHREPIWNLTPQQEVDKDD